MEAAIIKSVRNGAYITHAAGAAGISYSTLRDWMQLDVERGVAEPLRERIESARDAFTNESVEIIGELGRDDWRARAWLLERTRPAEFREQKDLQVTGDLTLEQVLFDDPSDTIESLDDLVEVKELPA